MNLRQLNFLSPSVRNITFGAIGGIIVFLFISYLWKNYGSTIALICLGGIILAIIFIYLIILLYQYIKIHREKNMNAELENQAGKVKYKSQLDAQVQDLKENWKQALTTLKSSSISIYDLPWILIIGEPQSGKTTTLRRSGLKFPIGKDKLSGGSGTVNCDWWFTTEAVILDTAGRFTMPVDSAPDKEEWKEFLKLLTKTRPRCPINGVIVTIPATSLLEDDEEKIKKQADLIREKLSELVIELGIVFPVNIMISKLDLVHGFTEFCSSLAHIEQTQIFGWNRPKLNTDAFDTSEFTNLFKNQCSRIYEWALRSLKSIPVGQQSNRIYAFPFEFNKLEAPLKLYLENIFQDNKYCPVMWRGCFFSSGIQKGESIQKVLDGRDKSFIKKIESVVKKTRPYFILNFYKKIFREKGLISQTGHAKKSELKLRVIAGSVGLILFILAGILLIPGYFNIKNTLKPVNDNVKIALETLKGECLGSENTFTLIHNLDENQKTIQHQISSKRFFHTKHSIANDLLRIRDAVSTKCFFRPLFEESLRKIDASKPQTESEKTKLVSDLQSYLEIMSDNKTDLPQSIRDRWHNPKLVDELWASFALNNKVSSVLPDDLKMLRKMRKGIYSIYKYWNFYPSHYCSEVLSSLKLASDAYNALLSVSGDNEIIGLSEKFEKFKSLNNSIQKKEGHEIQGITSPEKFKNQCNQDFEEIRTSISSDVTPEIQKLNSLIQRRQKVCQSEQNIYRCKQSQQAYGYLLNKQSEKFESAIITEVISAVLSYNPHVSNEQEIQINNPVSTDLFSLILSWQKEWQKQKIEIEKQIDSLKIISLDWKTDKLTLISKKYLDLLLWNANKDAAMRVKSRLMNEYELNSKRLSCCGKEPPLGAKAEYLSYYYSDIFKLLTFLKNQNTLNHKDFDEIDKDFKDTIYSSYRNSLRYWQRSIRSYNPAAGLLGITDWSKFKRKIIHKKGRFIDIETWPLKEFLKYFSSKDQEHLKQTYKQVMGKNLYDASIDSLTTELARTASIYEGQMMSELENAQIEYLDRIKAIPDHYGQQADNYLLSTFSNFTLNAGSNIRNDRYLKALKKIESHGNNLLSNKIKNGYNSQWLGFNKSFKDSLNACNTILGNIFPFNYVQESIVNKRCLSNISFHSISVRHFSEFLFKKDDAMIFTSITPLTILNDQYNILKNDLPSFYCLSQEEEQFLADCMAWRNFLFDKNQEPKKHSIRIELAKTNNSGKISIGSKYTVLEIWTSLKNSLRLRTVGNIKNKSGNIQWHFGINPKITIKAKNDATGKTCTIEIVGGDAIFPAFVLSRGKKPINIADNRTWEIDLLLPGNNKGIEFKLIIEWDEEIPKRISIP